MVPPQSSVPWSVGGEHLQLCEHWDGGRRGLLDEVHRAVFFLLRPACS